MRFCQNGEYKYEQKHETIVLKFFYKLGENLAEMEPLKTKTKKNEDCCKLLNEHKRLEIKKKYSPVFEGKIVSSLILISIQSIKR